MNSPIRTNQVIFKVDIAALNDKYDVFRVKTDDKYFKHGDTQRNVLTEFNSNNTELLDAEQVKQKLLSLQYIRDELDKLGITY